MPNGRKPMPHVDNETNQMHVSLGKFVLSFADAELQLKLLCRELGGRDTSSINILLIDTSVSSCISLLKNCHKFNDVDMSENLKKTLEQLGIISTQRNKILHNGFVPTPDGLVNRRFLLMPFRSKYKEEIFCVQDIENMIFDLTLIQRSLSISRYDIPYPILEPDHTRPAEAFIKAFQLPSPSPWKYRGNLH